MLGGFEMFGAGMMAFTVIITLISFAIPIVFLFLFFKWNAGRRAEVHAIMQTGMPAQARVLQIAQTGVQINDQPQLSIALEVHPTPMANDPRGAVPPFAANLTLIVPMMALPRVQPGQVLPVRFDPANPSRIAIDWQSMGYAM